MGYRPSRDRGGAVAPESGPWSRPAVRRESHLRRERRARFFTGPNAGFAAIEDIFLNMEGAAEWARVKYHQAVRKPGLTDEAAIIAFLRGKENSWSQDEGLALVLLLDKERPGWQEHVLGAEHAALFDLLAV